MGSGEAGSFVCEGHRLMGSQEIPTPQSRYQRAMLQSQDKPMPLPFLVLAAAYRQLLGGRQADLK